MTPLDLPISLATFGSLGLLLVGLASRVSQLRMRHKVAYGDGGHPGLMRAIRTHGNTAEHAPLFMMLVLVAELSRGSTLFLAVVAATFVAGRLLFAAGVLGRGLNPLRMIGAGVTYFLQLLLAACVLLSAFSNI